MFQIRKQEWFTSRILFHIVIWYIWIIIWFIQNKISLCWEDRYHIKQSIQIFGKEDEEIQEFSKS